MKITSVGIITSLTAALTLLCACSSPAKPQDPVVQPDRVAEVIQNQSSSESQLPLPESAPESAPQPSESTPQPSESTPAPTSSVEAAPPASSQSPSAPSQPQSSVSSQAPPVVAVPDGNTAPSVEVVNQTGVTLERWIADNVSGGTDTQGWALEQYKAAQADTRWQPAIIALKRSLENTLSPQDYAGIDYVSVTRTDADGYSMTLYTGLHVYTVNDDTANAAIAAVMQTYDESAGKVALITSHAKRSLTRLREIEAEIRSQSFYNDKIAGTQIPVFKGFAYEKGGLVVLLSTKSQALSNYIAKHPDGTAIGYRTGETFGSPAGTSTGTSTGTTGGTSTGTAGGTSAGSYSSLNQYLASISDSTQRTWVQNVYNAYNAKWGWQAALAQLRSTVQSSFANTEYASVDFIYEIYPYDPSVTIPVGFEVYAVSSTKAQSVVEAAKKKVYNDSLGNLQIKYSSVKLSRKDLEDTMADIQSQPFFRNTDSNGNRYVVGWYITKGTVEIWLTQKFPALDAYLSTHPNGHAIGYITGKSAPPA